jgi:RNA polymerase sigma-70 factor (ECF subfamily)
MSVDELTSLIERARNGHADAFDALVDLYANRLFGFLYRLTGSRTDAEDLLQELFVRVVRMLPRYEHRGALEGWLFRIATNLVRDHFRRVQRIPPTLSIHAELNTGTAESGGSPPQHVDRGAEPPERAMQVREDADALQIALAQLPTAEREVVMLRHFSDMSFADIAEAMDTPLGTALARGHRGLAKLRSLMEPNHDAG